MAEGDAVCRAASAPLGLRSLRFPRGGSSLGRRRVHTEALPLAARAMHCPRSPLLQNTLPKSLRPLVRLPVPAVCCPQPLQLPCLREKPLTGVGCASLKSTPASGIGVFAGLPLVKPVCGGFIRGGPCVHVSVGQTSQAQVVRFTPGLTQKGRTCSLHPVLDPWHGASKPFGTMSCSSGVQSWSCSQ